MTPILKMKQDVKTLWVNALLNDEYKKGTGRLKHVDGCMCVLGVLTDLAVKAGVGKWYVPHKPATSVIYMSKANGLETACLADEVIEWAGLHYTEEGACYGVNLYDPVIDLDERTTLSTMNDWYPTSFKQMGEFINTHVIGY